jgi:hypothetical protein
MFRKKIFSDNYSKGLHDARMGIMKFSGMIKDGASRKFKREIHDFYESFHNETTVRIDYFIRRLCIITFLEFFTGRSIAQINLGDLNLEKLHITVNTFSLLALKRTLRTSLWDGIPLIRSFISLRKEENEVNKLYKSLIDILVSNTINDDMDIFPNINFYELPSVHVFIGGNISGSDFTCLVVKKLATHERIQEKVYAEIVKYVETESSDLNPYLNACILETYRMNIIFSVPRTNSKQVELGGYTIPKGSNILLNFGAIHMSPDHYEDPKQFYPERFLDVVDGVYKCNTNMFAPRTRDFTFLPFGAGARGCPGMKLGHQSVHDMMVHLIYHFKIERTEDPEMFKFIKRTLDTS